jgi:hypothetical protein
VLRLGAALFILSDLMLAVEMFVARDPGLRRGLARVLWPAYWAGQALIGWAHWRSGAWVRGDALPGGQSD